MTDRERGFKILKQFYDNARSYYPFSVQYTFDEMIKVLETRLGGKTFADSLGLGATVAEMSDDDTYEAMRSLARQSGGKIPAKNGDFRSFMIDRATQVSFTDAIAYTATESAKTITEGFQEVGETLISTGKILNLIFIPVVLYFGFKFLNKKVSSA